MTVARKYNRRQLGRDDNNCMGDAEQQGIICDNIMVLGESIWAQNDEIMPYNSLYNQKTHRLDQPSVIGGGHS